MDQRNDKLLSRCIDLENEIQTICEPDQLTWSAVLEARQRLSNITRKLNNIHNSKLAINNIARDVLYNIFAFAIYESPCPWKTVLTISHVSCHWKEFALEWPSLWGDLNYDASKAILDLFISRSKNAPLRFSIRRPHRDLSEFLKSRADLILRRLRSLILHPSDSKSPTIMDDFRKFQSQPLRLHRLDIEFLAHVVDIQPFILNMDVSYLRELTLREVTLPWHKLPSNSNLTQCSLLYTANSPTLSQLLDFLSSCPSLLSFVLNIATRESHVDVEFEAPSTLDGPYLPKLEELVLEASGTSVPSYKYVHNLLARIRISKSLSRFNLRYRDLECGNQKSNQNEQDSDSDEWGSELLYLPFGVLDSVPPEIFSQCATYRYLSIIVNPHWEFLNVLAGPEYIPVAQDYPLRLDGPFRYCDNVPIFELIRAMPQITWLTLHYIAWEYVFRNVDVANAFPCLDSLELVRPEVDVYWKNGTLGRKSLELQWPHWTCAITSSTSISQKKLKLNTLLLGGYSFKPLDDVAEVVLKTETKVFKLSAELYNEERNSDIISALRRQEVMVVPVDV